MSMRRVFMAALVWACAGGGLAGCEGGYGPPVPPIPSCPQPARHAYALDVTAAGRVRWETPLATRGNGLVPGSGQRLAPLAAGAVAVFVQDDVVYGLRLADGYRMWSWASRQVVDDIWRWQGLVVVLTQQLPGASEVSLLTGLDAGTGQARWTLRIPGGTDEFDATADGGLAMVRADSVLQVADLSSGRARWARPAGFLPATAVGNMQSAMAVTAGMVILAVNGQLTGYDDRTGRVRWSEALKPVQLAAGDGELGLQASAGLVYLTAVQQRSGGQWTPVLLGISAADGRVRWQFAANPSQSLYVYGPGLMSITSSTGSTWQYDLDPATGKVRWQAAASYRATVTPAGIITASSLDGAGELSMRDALTGQSHWTAPLTGLGGGPELPVFPAGALLVVPEVGPDGSGLLVAFRTSDGHRVWQATTPTQLPAPLSAVPGGMLVYSATVIYGCG